MTPFLGKVLAQANLPSSVLLDAVVQSSLIVEGVVTPDTELRYDQDGRIETLHRLEIARVLKGNYQLASVWIPTLGGSLDGITQTVSHGTRLRPKTKGIFLLQPSAQSEVYYLQGGNAGKITKLSGGDDFEAIHWGHLDKYRSWRKLRESIGFAAGIDLTIPPLTQAAFQQLTQDKEFCVKLDNPVPDVEAMTVEFDVMAKSNVAGLKFGRAEIIIDYPTGNLGDFIVDQEKVEGEKGAIIDEPTYTLEVLDKSEDQIELAIESDCQGSGPHYVLDTVYEKLATLTVKVTEWADLGTINVTDFSVAGEAEYILPATLQGTPGCEPFDDLCGEGSFPLNACTVSQVSYTDKGAGYLDEITITGTNFVGNNNFLQELQVPSADDGGASSFAYGPLDNATIVNWTDTEIRFRVESYQAVDLVDVGPKDPMGSGTVSIDPDLNSTDPGTLVCFAGVDIDYSVGSGFDSDAGYWKTGGIVFLSAESSTGSLEVYLDATISQNSTLSDQGITESIMESMLADVICEYEKATGLKIEYKGTALQSSVDRADVFVGFRSLAIGELGLTTISYIDGCVGSNDPQFYGRRRAGVNQAITLFLDENPGGWYLGAAGSIPNGKSDLHSVLLHEFGHAIGLGHAQIDDDPATVAGEPIMYYLEDNTQTRRMLDSDTQTGGKRLVDLSAAAIQPTRCFTGFLLNQDPTCTTSNTRDVNVNQLCESVYFTDPTTLRIQCEPEVLFVSVYDLTGRSVEVNPLGSDSYFIQKSPSPSLRLLFIQFKDGRTSTIKLIQP